MFLSPPDSKILGSRTFACHLCDPTQSPVRGTVNTAGFVQVLEGNPELRREMRAEAAEKLAEMQE